eukprot:TRINITY_DN9016_c0_g1_i1.p1 TRINITY_DN9016_c0_g1~~TRINITY_DN9016_c0_g1_i1.p1  ORF type:complete len:482 (+),score=47.90 TRINITY_DN9016_c0_g1_i1:113-1558(+)
MTCSKPPTVTVNMAPLLESMDASTPAPPGRSCTMRSRMDYIVDPFSDSHCKVTPPKVDEIETVQSLYDWWESDQGRLPPYLVAFVNSRSGNLMVSRAIISTLETLLGHEFRDSAGTTEYHLAGRVCDLARVVESPTHVLDTILDVRKHVKRRSLRFLVCGGDGTVTWVLQEIAACNQSHPYLVGADPAVGIVPAGTGNDLSRSLGWGPKLKSVADLVGYVQWAVEGSVVELDQWKVTLKIKGGTTSEGGFGELPPVFRQLDPDRGFEVYEGLFQNYFSIGMDGAVTYGVHMSRVSCCGSCCFKCGCGKGCYAVQGCRAGSCCCCLSRPISIRPDAVVHSGTDEWEFDASKQTVRQLTMLNINSYGSGAVVHSDATLRRVRPMDGKLELFGVKNICSLTCLNLGLQSAKNVQQVDRMRLTLEKGEYFQMDGEGWQLTCGCDVEVSLNKKVPMLRPPVCRTGIWRGRQVPGFWGPGSRAGGCA